MKFDLTLARQVAQFVMTEPSEIALDESFAQVCRYLSGDAARHSRKQNHALIFDPVGSDKLARKYIAGYRQSVFPNIPGTRADELVSLVMRVAYGYSSKATERLKLEHLHSMIAEKCVGELLERYIETKLRTAGWHWCCGNFVRAVDFIRPLADGLWQVLQIKNRDNSENSSSSAIRHGTEIEKWFRFFSRTGETNWEALPEFMRGYGLSESGFAEFATEYLQAEKKRRAGKAAKATPKKRNGGS